MRKILIVSYKWARRCAVAVIGGSVVLVGIAMIVLPGPAFVVIPAGLGILSLEFAFAKRWLEKIKDTGGYWVAKFSKSSAKKKPPQSSGWAVSNTEKDGR